MQFSRFLEVNRDGAEVMRTIKSGKVVTKVESFTSCKLLIQTIDSRSTASPIVGYTRLNF